jgi:sugar phosphate isomerase/epimerase
MKSAITVSLVPQAKGGPFVFSNGLPDACRHAASLGFDAIEIFPLSAEAIDRRELRDMLDRHGLEVAAIGTGGGWVAHQWHLCHADATIREHALKFIRAIVALAAEFEAPAILGSMQGRAEGAVSRRQALDWLAEALRELGALASSCGRPLLYEPLNRYETNLFNRLGEACAFLESLQTQNVKLLADFFHMNMEESSIGDAIRAAGSRVGHVHFADSNRRAMGFGHIDAVPIIDALRAIGYDRYLSAEVLPLPDAEAAARQTISAFKRLTAGV